MDRLRLGTVITLALVWILGLSVTGALAAETPRRGACLPFVVPAESLSFAGHRETAFGVIHPLVPFYRTLILTHPETPANPLQVAESSPSAKTFQAISAGRMASVANPTPTHASRAVRVGVSPNPPIAILNPNGQPAGFAVDVINDVAAREHWQVTFVQDLWPALLKRFEAGEVDILSGVAFSQKRMRLFDFTSQTLLSNWGVIYRHPEVLVNSILDLAGKRLALPTKGIHSIAISDLLQSFSVTYAPIPAESFLHALELVQQGKADAAVVNRLIGIMHAHKYGVVSTAINFNPVELRFATPKGKGADLRAGIDRYLAEGKRVAVSAYHQHLNRWLQTPGKITLPRWLLWSAGVIFVALGIALVFIWLLRQRVRVQTWELHQEHQRLMASETRYRNLFETSRDGIAFVSLEGFIEDANQAYLDMAGYSLQDLRTKTYQDLTPEKWWAMDAEIIGRQVMKRGYSNEYEKERLRQDGTIIPISVRLGLMRDAQGNALLMITIVRDSTERKQAEEQIKHHTTALEQAVREKTHEMERLTERLLRQEKLATIGQISGSIAHELRNPLGAIKQAVYYLKEVTDPAQDRQRHFLDLIQREADSANRVMTDLLEMSRTKELSCRWVELRDIVMDAIASCPLQDKLQLTVDPAPCQVWVDSHQMRQVFINLLTNAAQASPHAGQVTFNARMVQEEARCEIQIRDQGGGIAPEDIERVFEPLYTTKAKGTGLGLSICKQIVELHGGQITLSSQLDQGTTVQIFLPSPAQSAQDDLSSQGM